MVGLVFKTVLYMGYNIYDQNDAIMYKNYAVMTKIVSHWMYIYAHVNYYKVSNLLKHS